MGLDWNRGWWRMRVIRMHGPAREKTRVDLADILNSHDAEFVGPIRRITEREPTRKKTIEIAAACFGGAEPKWLAPHMWKTRARADIRRVLIKRYWTGVRPLVYEATGYTAFHAADEVADALRVFTGRTAKSIGARALHALLRAALWTPEGNVVGLGYGPNLDLPEVVDAGPLYGR